MDAPAPSPAAELVAIEPSRDSRVVHPVDRRAKTRSAIFDRVSMGRGPIRP